MFALSYLKSARENMSRSISLCLLGDPTSVTAATDAGKNYDNYVITVKGFTETAGELSSVQDGCDNTDATYYALLKRCVDRHLFTSLIILFVSINILCFIYL